MPWNDTSPDGSQSVAANNSIIQANTTYIEATMGNDHYWDESTNEDGRHKYTNMPNQSSAPSISTGMDGINYLLENVSSQPYFRNSDSIMQMLGIRAMAVFNGAGTIAYGYNVATVAATATGFYTVTFTTALPNNNYLVLGNAIRNDSTSSKELLFEIQSTTTLTNVKSTALVKIMTRSDIGIVHTPLQAWIVCFGG